MIKYDERFFILNKCVFLKEKKHITVSFFGIDNFEPEIPKHEGMILRQMVDYLNDPKIKIDFEYLTPPKTEIAGDATEKLERVNAYVKSVVASLPPAVDKVLPVKNIEYLLGAVIKIRPTRIIHLRNTADYQVTAGSIHFLKQREYKRVVPNPDGGEGNTVTKTYWTFALDDGNDRLQCVFFPSEKTRAKFEKLGERSVVAVIGVREKRDGRDNFNVRGVSYCEFINAPAPEPTK